MNRLGLVIALAVVVCGLLAFYQQAAVSMRGGEGVPLYSVERHDPYGLAALQELLQRRGVQTSTLEQPVPDASSASRPAVLIQAISSNDAGRPWFQGQQLINWMNDGNTIIQLSRVPTDLMQKLHITATTRPTKNAVSDAEDVEERGVDPDTATASASRADTLSPATARTLLLWSPMKLVARKDPDWTPIARLRDGGDLVAASFRVGKGKLILIGAPTPALNGLLASEDNLDFLLETIGSGPVLIDEWSHGVSRDPTIIGFIRDAGLLPMLFQIGFIAVLYVWSAAGFAPPPRAVVAVRRAAVQQIHTLGYLYSCSLNLQAAGERVRAEVRRRLGVSIKGAANLSAPLKAEHDQLLRQAENVASASEMAGLLSRSHQFTMEVSRERHGH